MFSEFKDDYFRYYGSNKISFLRIIKDHSLRYLFCLRGGGMAAVPTKAYADKVWT